MTLFRLCHAQKDAFAFFVALSFGEIAIGSRGLDFRLPIAPSNINGLLMNFLLGSHVPIKAQGGAVSNPPQNSGKRARARTAVSAFNQRAPAHRLKSAGSALAVAGR